MQDTLLLRMRQTGMFDLLTLLLAIALAFTALGVIGVIQYNVQMNNMPEGLTDYEIRRAWVISPDHAAASSPTV